MTHTSAMRARSRHGAAAGLALAGVGLGAQAALYVIDERIPFAPYSIAQWVVTLAPGSAATAAIDNLGHWALRLVAITAVLIALLAGAAVGAVVAERRATVLAAGAVVITALAGVVDPRQPSWRGTAVAAVVPAVAILLTWGALATPARIDAPEGAPSLTRRRFVAAGTLAGAALLLGSGVVRALLTALPGAVRADRRAAVEPDVSFDAIAGLTPAITSRSDHYVVDINLDAPRVDATSWRLRIDGEVRTPIELDLDALRAMPTVERPTMLSCISNHVGGGLTGNALWTGVPLASLLDRAGAGRDSAVMRATAADGYEDTIPMARARKSGALVAIGMDGLLLPAAHGFPARLLVPGLYGMKNVKWLTGLTVLAHDEQGYWEQRGWDLVAEVRTESRIDVPEDHAEVDRNMMVAGVAWAGDRRIARVELDVDDRGEWRQAELERELGPYAWRRWRLPVSLPPGTHSLQVRAHDGDGRVQDATHRAPHPAGASGYHRIAVTVRR
jgi:DMSO/TMAO reductase YedYZ molybdopterin-dependent catalytic subunit